MKNAFFIGCILLLLSAWPLSLMGIEIFAADYALERYRITIIDTPETTFGEHTIRADANQHPPRITIDGRDCTSPTGSDKCLLALLEDRNANQEFLTITNPEPRASYRDLHYRILRVPRIGPVQEELFHKDDRIPFLPGNAYDEHCTATIRVVFGCRLRLAWTNFSDPISVAQWDRRSNINYCGRN